MLFFFFSFFPLTERDCKKKWPSFLLCIGGGGGGGGGGDCGDCGGCGGCGGWCSNFDSWCQREGETCFLCSFPPPSFLLHTSIQRYDEDAFPHFADLFFFVCGCTAMYCTSATRSNPVLRAEDVGSNLQSFAQKRQTQPTTDS